MRARSIDNSPSENHDAGEKKEDACDRDASDPHALGFFSNVHRAPSAEKRYTEDAGEKRDDLDDPVRSNVSYGKDGQNGRAKHSEEKENRID